MSPTTAAGRQLLRFLESVDPFVYPEVVYGDQTIAAIEAEALGCRANSADRARVLRFRVSLFGRVAFVAVWLPLVIVDRGWRQLPREGESWNR